MNRYLLLLLLVVSSTGNAVVIRHDVDDAKYRIPASAFPALADMPGEGHGVLIAPQWVVTTGHTAPSSGVEEIAIGGASHRIERVFIHPGYRALPDVLIQEALASGDASAIHAFLALSDDIALIKLESPVLDVAPVVLHRGDDEIGKTIALIGKGATGNGIDGQIPHSPHRTVLRRAFNVVEGTDERWLWYVFDTPATGLAQEGTIGSGDSGGAVVIEDQGSMQLVGLANWVKYVEDMVPTIHPGFYGQVVHNIRISKYAEWIESVIHRTGTSTMNALSGEAEQDAINGELQSIVDRRLAGDRTGACMAVAVIEKDHVARTYRCADPGDAGRIDANTAFEIGSVSKTMTAVLLADLIGQGKASLDDPLAACLPEGTSVPAFEGLPILLRHVVTHTSGLPALPSRLGATSMEDPYSNLTEEALLASLGDVVLSAAPGTTSEYSNFASMVLSYAVARRAGSDLEGLLKQRLFAPLGMDKAYVNDRPEGVRAAVGHTPNTQPAPAWNFATNLAGVGGVRATLDDMVRYVQGNLGLIESSISPALEFAQRQVGEKQEMAMNWMLVPVAGRTVHMHEGGTGGFSAFVSVDRDRQRGVVILSDTAWSSIGNLGSLGLHLVDPSFLLGKPRKLAPPPQALLDGLEGAYRMQPFPPVSLRQDDGKLFGRVAGQEEFELAYDDAGDFFPVTVDALLRPQKKASGDYGFVLMQLGGVFSATRIAEGDEVMVVPELSSEELEAYAGEYPLMPDFALTVRARQGNLHAQATGQGEFPLEASGKDTFEAASFGIELVFKRDENGSVVSLELHQAGQILTGKRQ